MKIQCILTREGGSRVELDGVEYHFEPLADGAHVAEVENKAHVDRFLGIPEGYKLYHGDLEPVGKPLQLKPTVVSDPMDIRLNSRTTRTDAFLYGSDVHEAVYEIGGKAYQLGDVVALAHTKSGLSVEDWNALDVDDRHAKIDIVLDELAEAAEKQPANTTDETKAPAADDRDALVAQFVAKFGSKPHHNASIATIKARLAE